KTRLCRVGDGRVGLVADSNVRYVTPALDVLPVYTYPPPLHDVFIANLDRVAERARAIAGTCPQLPVAGLRFWSPVANPSKVIGAPVNYQKHLDEVRSDAQLHQGSEAHTAPIHKMRSEERRGRERASM